MAIAMQHGLDWSMDPSELPEHLRFIRSVNWSDTELGPPTQWPAQLHQAIDFMLVDPTPAAIMWGDRLTMVYNSGFVEFAGSKHPTLMGKSPITEYAEVWDVFGFGDIIDRGRRLGQATSHKDVRLLLNRHGWLEECFVTYTFIPLLGADKSVVGFYHTAHDTTNHILSVRRTRTLLGVSDVVASSRTISDYWRNLITSLKDNDDLQWALAYSFKIDGDAQSILPSIDPMASAKMARASKSCAFVGSTLPTNDRVPAHIGRQSEQDSLISAIDSAITSGESVPIRQDDPGSPSWLFTLSGPAEDNQTCQTVLVLPTRSSTTDDETSHNLIGFLLVGLSPYRRYDDDFQQFMHLASRQMGTAAATIALLEKEKSRQEQLDKQLLTSAPPAQEFKENFNRFTEVSNIGMWIASSKGELLYANDAWYRQADLDPKVEDMCVEKWTPLVTDESLANFAHHWGLLMQHGQAVTFECQFKARWRSRNAVTGEMMEGPQWFLISALPEFYEDGTLRAAWGCNVDVSFQKWAQSREQLRLEETLEAKMHTERFLEFLSHELRNPLSAMLQSADDIASTVDEAVKSRSTADGVNLVEAEICSMSESVATIINCTQHQKRIMDDILTLSKLDARLLPVSMVAVDPRLAIKHALNMHQQSLKSASVLGSIQVDKSYDQLSIEKVLLDPSRLLQVLINLITNAIKFTQFQSTRRVTLHLAASMDNPADGNGDEQYFAPRELDRSLPSSNIGNADPDCITGEEVYLKFAVEDTGCGLTPEEMQRLFTRFTQASPKTHVKYGGSGLGLFICKELTELQGGRIGVTSVPGEGSTFKFYLKVKRAVSVEEAAENNAQQLEQVSTVASVNGNGTAKAAGTLRDPEYRHPMNRSPHSESTNPVVGSVSNPDTLHVLVVEDNLINQKVMANQLRKAGCIVHVADHGGRALHFLKKTTFAKDCPPDAIPLSLCLMDLEMPVMGGLECVSRIREMQSTGEFTRPVPVIAVTANARMEQIAEAKKHGMDDVVTKPFRVGELLPIMYSLISKVSV